MPFKKTVLITGCSSGIGKATVREFARNGWNVIATMRTPDAETELRGLDNVLIARLDVQDLASIDQAIAAGIARFGRIDALINNAGFSLFGVFEALSREKIREQFDVNLFGLMDVTRAVLPHFRKNKGGLIVNVSSRAGIVTLPMISLYNATKFALEGFTESLAYELASQNIAVKIVQPSGTSTNFSKRAGEEYAHNAELADYDAFVAHTNAIFDQLRASRLTTAEEVAQAIYAASIDGSDRLRYYVGDDVGGLVKAKQEMSDAEYVAFARAWFVPKIS
ncbi:MAG TPA: SDR family oxidoreductase [Steroidobacteraceae bacterium]|jgi:NAD(P)-dependent dehydrogenase (short-subunit alcohol dehydrogenase family)